MNHDAFKQIDALFHELLGLDAIEQRARLEALRRVDAQKSQLLDSMLRAAAEPGAFLDPDEIVPHLPEHIDIPLDGSVLLNNRYRIVEQIGIGGSSSVFRARMSNPDRDVAIKMLRVGLRSTSARSRFEQESRTLADFAHPHVAHIYETGVHTFEQLGVPWIAMELVQSARSLRAYAEDESLSREQKRALLLRVLDAMSAAHTQGVLHLDLNADNILIDRYGHPKIIDFGLSGLMSTHIPDRVTHMGTRVSMAPEQTSFRTAQFDPRTDIYALGLLCVELLCGRRLQSFDQLEDADARASIRAGKPRELLETITDLGEHEKALISRMLCVDPEDRPSSVAEVIHQLERGQSPNASRRINTALIAFGSIPALMLLMILALALNQPGAQSVKPQQPISDTPSTNQGLQIPTTLAMEISQQNPRNTDHQPSLDRVIEGISQALSGADSLSSEELAGLHAALADRFRVAGRFNESIEHYRLAIEACDRLDDIGSRDAVRLSLAQLYLYLSEPQEAELLLEQIHRGRQADPVFLLDLSIAEAELHLMRENYDSAGKQVIYALELVGGLEPTKRPQQTDRLLQLASLAIQAGDRDLAEQIHETTRSIVESSPDRQHYQIAMVDMAIANAMYALDDPSSFDPAIRIANTAVEMMSQTDDRFHEAWVRRQAGHMYLSKGDAQSANRLYTESFDILRRTLDTEHHETRLTSGYLAISELLLNPGNSIAEERYRHAIAGLSEQLGPEHAAVVTLIDAHSRALDTGNP